VSSSRTDQLLEIVMPQLGISVTEGTLLEWRKQPGDHVDADETICEVSTDKIDSEIPAPRGGRIVELLVEAGATVDVGTVIATLAPEDAPGGSSSAGEVALGAEAAPAGPVPEDSSSPRGGGRYSPVVQRIAAEHGVALDELVGTGRDGRVRKEDVLAAVERSASPQAAAPAAGELAQGAPYAPPPAGELSRMRRMIGEHMQRSLRTAATVTSWIEVDFERVEARRRALGITALPVVAAATAATLGEFGDLNAWLDGEQYTRHSDVNLGIAVSLGAEGLIVPVVHGAQRLDLEALAGRISELATRARDHTLSPDEVRDGTFTITNPGQFGTLMATPVINQPQVAILDVEAIVKRAVVVADAGGDAIAIRGVCILGLSWDHRALDGAYAARFLAALRDRLEATEG
jgi:pyruvate/2-oxoglutarate dehydrogenase complex dihydrolipoamide acyltransferase (E2) component